jgi:tellurite resistance protein TerC
MSHHSNSRFRLFEEKMKYFKDLFIYIEIRDHFIVGAGGDTLSGKKAFVWVLFWFDLTLCFCIWIFIVLGRVKALEFISGFVIEQSLSIDNLFLFIVIFSSFGITTDNQRRVLNYGIAGAFVLRLIFIVLGIRIINSFHWLLNVFGFILILSGVQMMFKKEERTNYEDSRIIQFIGRFFRITDKLEGDKFFIKKNNLLFATPLFVILVLIELTDIIFALDSIPSIFSVSTDPFIVFTSNIFAIIGLRNLYFVLGKVHEQFHYVKYGIAAILTFTGIKLFVMIFGVHISPERSLAIIISLMAGSIGASIVFTATKHKQIKV